MHDILRQRVIRKLESLPDERVYQVLDYIEFLESKYAEEPSAASSGLRRFAERFEDRMRKNAVRPRAIRGAVSVLATADRIIGGVARGVGRTGRTLVDEITSSGEVASSGEVEERPSGEAERSSGRAPDREEEG